MRGLFRLHPLRYPVDALNRQTLLSRFVGTPFSPFISNFVKVCRNGAKRPFRQTLFLLLRGQSAQVCGAKAVGIRVLTTNTAPRLGRFIGGFGYAVRAVTARRGTCRGRAVSKGGLAPAIRLARGSGGHMAHGITAVSGMGAGMAFSRRVPAVRDGGEGRGGVCFRRLCKEAHFCLVGLTAVHPAKRLRETRAESYSAATGRAVIGLRMYEELVYYLFGSYAGERYAKFGLSA